MNSLNARKVEQIHDTGSLAQDVTRDADLFSSYRSQMAIEQKLVFSLLSIMGNVWYGTAHFQISFMPWFS